MKTIVTEIMEILKGSNNIILREENLMLYFSALFLVLMGSDLPEIVLLAYNIDRISSETHFLK